jgi:hypothetical protein
LILENYQIKKKNPRPREGLGKMSIINFKEAVFLGEAGGGVKHRR